MEITGRHLEFSLSEKLHELSELNRQLERRASSGGLDSAAAVAADAENQIGADVRFVETEAKSLLDQLGALVDKYSGDSPDARALSQSQRVFLDGLRSVHRRDGPELRRLSMSVHHKLDNAKLLAGVWNASRTQDLSAEAQLLRERNRWVGCLRAYVRTWLQHRKLGRWRTTTCLDAARRQATRFVPCPPR
jgi:hypothetical protein